MRADEQRIGYFGVTLPVWSVYMLGVLAILIGLAIPVVLRYTGWLQGQVPGSAVRPGREVRPVMMRLPGGRFPMGSPDTEDGRDDDETLHWVRISPFEMCQTEVTQENWRAVMDRHPSDCDYGCGDEVPVHDISWFDAIEYLNALTELENETRQKKGETEMTPCYKIDGEDVTWVQGCTGYRLPTEAEWEYAARARSSVTAYEFDDDPAKLGEYAWYEENSGNKAHAVGGPDKPGSKKPNSWQLYDMHGNVWEWVWDWYGPYQTSSRENPLVDPRGPGRDEAEETSIGKAHVLRGGSFGSTARYLRSADRVRDMPALRGVDVGFRCARDVSSASTP